MARAVNIGENVFFNVLSVRLSLASFSSLSLHRFLVVCSRTHRSGFLKKCRRSLLAFMRTPLVHARTEGDVFNRVSTVLIDFYTSSITASNLLSYLRVFKSQSLGEFLPVRLTDVFLYLKSLLETLAL